MKNGELLYRCFECDIRVRHLLVIGHNLPKELIGLQGFKTLITINSFTRLRR